MNLLNDVWLPIITHTGDKKTIKLAEISDSTINELDFNRMDFQGAGYQLLIGLLQTTFAPDSTDEWEERLVSPPSEDDLQQAFDKVSYAFELEGDGARFMQDFDSLADVKEPNGIAGLLIDAPGDNTIKLNKDFFIKRNTVTALSAEMATIALYTLQINAPSGGQGHRTGLRGGGPMVTLIRPDSKKTLWEKLWWNVINKESWGYDDIDFDNIDEAKLVFPWLAPTNISDKGVAVYPKDVHPLYQYWAMPRRIRLIIEENSTSLIDDITQKTSEKIVKFYKTKNYGNDYQEDWSQDSAFTPYRFNPKKPDDLPFSIKGQPGGINYKIWHFLTLSSQEDGFIRAKVIDHANDIAESSYAEVKSPHSIWAFAYDMDNMKARGFYSAELPMLYIADEYKTALLTSVKELYDLSDSMLKATRDAIKYGLMAERQAKDSKGDLSNIDAMFWQRSQPLFFGLITQASDNQGELPPKASLEWLRKMRLLAEQLFDEQVLSVAVIKQRHMEQRNKLTGLLYGNKIARNFAERQKALLENNHQQVG